MNAKQIAERLRELIESNFLVTENPEFAAFVAMMPEKYWAKYDLSAVRLGWEAADLLERITWVPVSERLPELREYVMTWNGSRRAIDMLLNADTQRWESYKMDVLFLDEGDPFLSVTHWKPLPNPPSE